MRMQIEYFVDVIDSLSGVWILSPLQLQLHSYNLTINEESFRFSCAVIFYCCGGHWGACG